MYAPFLWSGAILPAMGINKTHINNGNKSVDYLRLLHYLTFLFTLFASELHAEVASGPDYARELRLHNEIADSIVVGEAVTLQANKHNFLGIYTESDADKVLGAAIIMHGRGLHPDWPGLTSPLRQDLPEHGWHTLSIQMPVLPMGKEYVDYLPLLPYSHNRINAAIHFLREQGAEKVVLIGHGCSVHMSMSYFKKSPIRDFDAFIGIGMGATDERQPQFEAWPLATLDFPVLDIFGSKEYSAVKERAATRFSAIRKAGHPDSRQVEIHGGDHFYSTDTSYEQFKQALTEWLQMVAQH